MEKKTKKLKQIIKKNRANKCTSSKAEQSQHYGLNRKHWEDQQLHVLYISFVLQLHFFSFVFTVSRRSRRDRTNDWSPDRDWFLPGSKKKRDRPRRSVREKLFLSQSRKSRNEFPVSHIFPETCKKKFLSQARKIEMNFPVSHIFPDLWFWKSVISALLNRATERCCSPAGCVLCCSLSMMEHVIFLIVPHLRPVDLAALEGVCKRVREVITLSLSWKNLCNLLHKKHHSLEDERKTSVKQHQDYVDNYARLAVPRDPYFCDRSRERVFVLLIPCPRTPYECMSWKQTCFAMDRSLFWQTSNYAMKAIACRWASNSISQHGSRLVTGHGSYGGGQGSACVWSYPSMQLLQVFPGYTRGVAVIQQSDELCFTGAQKIEIHRWNHSNAEEAATLVATLSVPNYQQLFDMYYHQSEESIIAVGNDDMLRIWDLATASITKQTNLGDGLRRCWVHRKAGCIFSCSFPRATELKVLDARTGKLVCLVFYLVN